MKTIGRFFLLTAAVAMLFSCSATGFNIFGKAPVDTESVSDSIGNASKTPAELSSIGKLDNGTLTIEIGGGNFYINTGLTANDKIYGQNTNISEELANAMDGGNGDALVEDLLQKPLSADESQILQNTSQLYSDILASIIDGLRTDNVPPEEDPNKDIINALGTISSGLDKLETSDSLTQADAALVQSMTSLTYTLLSVSDSLGNDFLKTPEAETVVNDLGLIINYSQSLGKTEVAGSSLATSFTDLYDSLKGAISGQGGTTI